MGLKSIKNQTLTRKWAVNVLSVVFILLLVFEVIISFIVYTYYYNSVAEYLFAEMNSIKTSFTSYSVKNVADFEAGAKEFVESFSERDSLEVQIFSNDGSIIMSTSGFIMGDNELTLNADNAIVSDNSELVVHNGQLSNGERVMVTDSEITSGGNGNIVLGSVRLLTSLRDTNRQLLYVVGIIIIAGCLMFLIIMFSGMYFLRSIIRPVREVGEIARQIASGDFDARIKSKSTDEIGQLCELINHMASELGSSERMKNEFISSVSHELRTPLTAIKGWAETIKDSYDDPAIMNKGFSVIISESERLSSLVEDLLDFSRLQNGQMTFRMQTCDVVAELSEAVLTYTDSAARAGINLIYSEPEALPLINGDASRLQQVFVNVIDNAIKYTPSGGSIAIGAQLDAGHIVIMISDSGAGIPEDELDKVKQKFFKGKHATRGSGIGLAVANEIILKHNGLLDIASTEHVGTTVTITLPVNTSGESEENTKK